MTEWDYKATTKKISFEATRDLALHEEFLCRSAHTIKGALIPNVKNVVVGDVIHLYYLEGANRRAIGSFRVVDDPRKELGRNVGRTALRVVSDREFEAHLLSLNDKRRDGEGYAPDPVVKKLTGWSIKLIPGEPPAFPEDFLTYGNSLRARKSSG